MEDREKLKKYEKIKGITLVALVVTIVVLIILATISIGALSREKGIIKQAKEAKELHENGRQEEKALNELMTEYNKEKNEIENNEESTQKKCKILVEVVNGTVTDNITEKDVPYNGSCTLHFTANPGYILDTASVDGTTVSMINDSYTFSDVTNDHTIRVIYKKKPFSISWLDGRTDTPIKTVICEEMSDNLIESLKPSDPTWDGHEFTGWTIGEPDEDGNIVIVANYKPIEL